RYDPRGSHLSSGYWRVNLGLKNSLNVNPKPRAISGKYSLSQKFSLSASVYVLSFMIYFLNYSQIMFYLKI
ncbi:hypothetical protein P6P35_16150, partial [Clostridium perfringens]|nr:hypothetical protein [Clostridium perfringens]